jgi:AraC-like DNA-binding protein
MELKDKALFFFSFLGAFNGFILGVYFLFFTTKKYLSNYLLGALLIMLSIRIGKSVIYFFDRDLSRIYLQLGLTACVFIGPFLYYFIKSEINHVSVMPKKWIGQMICWLLLILGVGVVYPYELFPKLWGNYIVPLIYIQWGLYVAFSFLLLIPLLQKFARSESLKTFEKWVLTICSGVTLLLGCYVWAYLNISRGSYINGALYFSLLIYGIVFVLLYRRKANDLSALSSRKYLDKKVDHDEAMLLVNRLTLVMREKRLFKNPNLKVNDLAKELNIAPHQVSQLLNDRLEKNFSAFVNEYRINEACLLLSEKVNLTIEAIGDEVGFNSSSTFFAAFKKIKGLTPSAYQQTLTPDL